MAIAPDGTAYDLTGPEGAPVVVLIHGLGLTRATWKDHVPAFSDRFQVLTYDLCGHGESALPGGTPSLTVLSDQIVRLLDHLGIDKAALVGFSLGGMINRRFVMDHPERTTALVIQNSPHERSPEAQALVEQRARDTGAGGPAATIEETLRRWFTPEFLADHPETVNWVRDTVLANDPDNYTGHRYVLAAGVTELIRPEPPITHPTLVMTCENDTGSTPAMSHAIASEIAGAKTIIVPGLQHLGLLERPAHFTGPTREFLIRHAG
jgi:(E)-2-((N-methylformamido)methylene)succinate hydrolase